jgi:DNA repair exonuclease SbcCD nuclease subunit
MKPLAIITGDWHIHKWKQFNQNNRRLKSNLDLFRLLGSKAKELDVPIIFTGDLFENAKQLHNSVITQSIKTYKKEIESKGVKFFAISGNHDQEEQNTINHHSSSYLEAFDEAFQSFKFLDKCIGYNKRLEIHGIPYLTGNVGFKELVRKIRKIPKTRTIRILVIHTDLHGALSTDGRETGTTENIPKDLGKFFKGFDLVVSGHIHKPQIIVPNHVYMIGAPQQQNRGDKNCQMGYWILYDNLKMKFIPTYYPMFIEISEDEYNQLSTEDKNSMSNYYIPIPKEEIAKDVQGFTSFSSNKGRTKIVKRWAKATGETDKLKLKTLKTILNKV